MEDGEIESSLGYIKYCPNKNLVCVVLGRTRMTQQSLRCLAAIEHTTCLIPYWVFTGFVAF